MAKEKGHVPVEYDVRSSLLYGLPSGATYWDDGLYTGVRTIELSFSSHVNSIAVGYRLHEEKITAKHHGGSGGQPIQRIDLDSDELIKTVIVYVSEEERSSRNTKVIRSLQFVTNLNRYGPFGPTTGEEIEFSVADGEKIIGFFGRGDEYVDAIGFHVSKT